jgi:DnaJ-class molecular chaperone
MEGNKNCPKCHGTGRINEEDRTIHVCWDCLNGNFFEQHGNPKESKIKV